MAFIKNFGLKSGALASSVAHDSHNIVAVGVSDEALSLAVNAVISEKGGISLADKGMVEKTGFAGSWFDEYKRRVPGSRKLYRYWMLKRKEWDPGY